MGSTASCGRRPEISERDVVTLCDNGDLLLQREHVVSTALRVAIDQRVAHDIAAFEHGAFPTTRYTTLAGTDLVWTSCSLLLRVGGVLHFLEVDVDGMRFVAFLDRVAQRQERRDIYAIRRLQHVRNEHTASVLRQFTLELSQVLPLAWSDYAADAAALEAVPLVCTAVQRMLELCASQGPTASPVDQSAQLAAVMVVAVYEQLHLLEPAALPTQTLTPSMMTASMPFTSANALGDEMRLV